MPSIGSSTAPALVLNSDDNVAVLLRDATAGASLTDAAGTPLVDEAGRPVAITSPAVQAGHKVAIRAIEAHGTVVKYGVAIGRATVDIARGEHVHVHNVESARLRGDLTDRNE